MKPTKRSSDQTPVRVFGFDSLIGPCGIAFRDNEIVGMMLPQKTLRETINKLSSRFPSSQVSPTASAFEKKTIDLLKLHLKNGNQNLSKMRISIETTPFFSKVYDAVKKIPAGHFITYGDVAKIVGKPKASRAIGQAMARNPIPIIVPCHRVVGSAGKLTGFSALGGLKLKAQLLSIEQKA
jgi:methylated-DNA-[protein]-cysteine S-methyltransferase